MQMLIPNCSKKIIHTVLEELEGWNLERKVTPITVQNSKDHHEVRRTPLSFLNKHRADPFHTKNPNPTNKPHTPNKQMKTRS